MVRKAVSLGGDSNTMACIAEGIAGCIYPIPGWIAKECENLLPHPLKVWMSGFEGYLDMLPLLRILDG